MNRMNALCHVNITVDKDVLLLSVILSNAVSVCVCVCVCVCVANLRLLMLKAATHARYGLPTNPTGAWLGVKSCSHTTLSLLLLPTSSLSDPCCTPTPYHGVTPHLVEWDMDFSSISTSIYSHSSSWQLVAILTSQRVICIFICVVVDLLHHVYSKLSL